MHEHDHAHHDHHRGSVANRRRLAITLALAAVYMLAEVIGGWLTNSLALLADAGHMLSDVAGLALSFFAVWIADRPAPAHRTYGYYRAEILAALVNGAVLVAVSIYIGMEAWHRFWDPPEVDAPIMLAIAVGGLVVNLAGLFVLHGGRESNLNMRGAWLHVLSDALGSVATIIAGVAIWTANWNWVDPLVSAIIGVLVIHSAWRLVSESVSVLMENAPRGIEVDQVRGAIVETQGVTSVHDLHIWTITSGLNALSAHVVVNSGVKHASVLRRIQDMLRERFGIDHITLQLEPEDFEHCENPV